MVANLAGALDEVNKIRINISQEINELSIDTVLGRKAHIACIADPKIATLLSLILQEIVTN